VFLNKLIFIQMNVGRSYMIYSILKLRMQFLLIIL